LRQRTDKVDSLGLGHDLTLGGVNNGGVCRIGRYAQQITLAEQGHGAIVTIRGPVNINDGTPGHERDAFLQVAGPITGQDLGATGNLGVSGQTTLFGQLDALGNVNIGTTQQPRTTTLNGQVDVNGGLAIDGALYVDAVKAHNGDSVKFSSSVALGEKLEVEGYSTFNSVTAHLAGINFNTAGTIPFNGIRFQNNRFEFYIASVLCFYIDTNGGHNA
jgi:hypothetical protein